MLPYGNDDWTPHIGLQCSSATLFEYGLILQANRRPTPKQVSERGSSYGGGRSTSDGCKDHLDSISSLAILTEEVTRVNLGGILIRAHAGQLNPWNLQPWRSYNLRLDKYFDAITLGIRIVEGIIPCNLAKISDRVKPGDGRATPDVLFSRMWSCKSDEPVN